MNKTIFEDFKEYLLTTTENKNKTILSKNSAVSYFHKVKAALRQAYKDGILQTDLNAIINLSRKKKQKEEETRREFISIEDLNELVKKPYNEPLLKHVAMFSALTGLRFSDIHRITWSEVQEVSEQGNFLNFKQHF